ncbi:MAG: 50S ribosomal protein L25 [Acidobacteriota bacterium]|nr:50S ribosomal protein L25 [Acidobacteriota bacterium]MDE3107244.1 50S ribosomal protein L25 [Acidobacteriota bacterium]MDE3223674.1 50S ribosomal protein L25 [Acidobacteriota bacterium]
MSQVTLHASTDRPQGSSNARRLRSAGSIPGVIYGEGVTPLPVAVNAKEFRSAVSGEQGLNSLITLDADGTNYLVMAREIQRHPVRGTVAHVDFQVVDPNKPVVAEVPLHVIGDAVEVRHADWEVDQQMFSLEIRTRPDRIPNFINVDISELKAGHTIRVSDLVLPDGVVAAAEPSVAVVATHAGRAAKATAGPDAATA